MRCFLNGVSRMRRRHLFALGAALAAPAVASHALAQAWPSRSIRTVVPFGAGGIIDVVARIIAEAMGRDLGVTMVVENMPGGGTTIGGRAVARAAPDGHTLLLTGASQAVVPALYPDAGYDIFTDFVPVAPLGDQPFVLAVNPGLPAQDVPSLIAWLKQRGGDANFATTGVGAASHLAGELLKTMAGVDFTVVPYRGTPQAVTDLVAGRADLMIDSQTLLAPMGAEGRVRLLAVTTPRRSAMLPALPTLAESGFPGFAASSWQALYAPRGTPQSVVQRLAAAAEAARRDSGVQRRFTEAGVEPFPGGPAELAAFLRAENARWTPILRAAGVKPG
jgi:tripartite-type tricarboxylate transporter receptor subunit TctC